MKNRISLPILVLLIVLASCGTLKSINPLSLLTGNSWTLASMMGNGTDVGQLSGALPSLDFLEGGKLSGFTGCNNFSGNFSLEGNSVKLDPGAITKKACPGSTEQEFISAIGKVNQLKVDKNKLILLDGATELMSFVPKAN